MEERNVEKGGQCPSCHEGVLVKNSMTKLECENCGWESIVRPEDSDTFVKPPTDNSTLEAICFFIVLILIVLVLLIDKF